MDIIVSGAGVGLQRHCKLVVHQMIQCDVVDQDLLPSSATTSHSRNGQRRRPSVPFLTLKRPKADAVQAERLGSFQMDVEVTRSGSDRSKETCTV